MEIYLIKSSEIDRRRNPVEIDAVCDKDGDPLCWRSIDSAEKYLYNQLLGQGYFIEKTESDKLLKDIFEYNKTTSLGLKLAIMP